MARGTDGPGRRALPAGRCIALNAPAACRGSDFDGERVPDPLRDMVRVPAAGATAAPGDDPNAQPAKTGR